MSFMRLLVLLGLTAALLVLAGRGGKLLKQGLDTARIVVVRLQLDSAASTLKYGRTIADLDLENVTDEEIGDFLRENSSSRIPGVDPSQDPWKTPFTLYLDESGTIWAVCSAGPNRFHEGWDEVGSLGDDICATFTISQEDSGGLQ